MRVLVIEDDSSVRETVAMALESLGHDPFSARDLKEGAQLLASAKPDVILLDLLLDGNISTPFINVIRETTKEHPPRIVVLSAMTKADEVAKANHVGFLAKPFEFDALRDVIFGK